MKQLHTRTVKNTNGRKSRGIFLFFFLSLLPNVPQRCFSCMVGVGFLIFYYFFFWWCNTTWTLFLACGCAVEHAWVQYILHSLADCWWRLTVRRQTPWLGGSCSVWVFFWFFLKCQRKTVPLLADATRAPRPPSNLKFVCQFFRPRWKTQKQKNNKKKTCPAESFSVFGCRRWLETCGV